MGRSAVTYQVILLWDCQLQDVMFQRDFKVCDILGYTDCESWVFLERSGGRFLLVTSQVNTLTDRLHPFDNGMTFVVRTPVSLVVML